MQTIVNQDISTAVAFLKKGEIIAIPTETVYGLAGNALNPDALINIFETKQRPFFDPLIIHLAEISQLHQYAVSVPDIIQEILNVFSPGPVSVILPKKEIIPDLASSGLPTAAFRIPSHPLAQSLLSSLPFPLAAPSANPFGYVSPTSPSHVMDQLGGKIPMILDGGDCPIGVESTILGYENDTLIIYREGGISREDILTQFPSLKITMYSGGVSPAAPGLLKSHYAPIKPIYLVSDLISTSSIQSGIPGVLSFTNPFIEIQTPYRVVLSPSGSLHEAARNLFAALRQLDKSACDYILAEPVPEHGIGRAINDRLNKASYKQSLNH